MGDSGSRGRSPTVKTDTGAPRKRPPPMQAEKDSGVAVESVSVRLGLLQQLMNALGEVDIHRLQMQQQNRALAGNLDELTRILKRMQQQMRAQEQDAVAHVSPHLAKNSRAAQPVTPDMSVTGKLMRAFSESLGSLSDVGSELRDLSRGMDSQLLQQASATNQLQGGLLRTHKVPVAPATVDVLLVKVMDKLFAIPHGCIDWIVQAGAHEQAEDRATKAPGISYAGDEYPLRYLGTMLGLAESVGADISAPYPVLLVTSGEERAAIQLDGLLGNRRVMAQSLGPQLGNLRWFTGGAILAEGDIALLLDLKLLLRSNVNRDRAHE